jgi:transcriptional regulator with XRE-family HTH domain
MLGMTRAQLAKASKVSARAIADFEAEKRQPINATLEAVQRALEAAGVEFTNGDSPGIHIALQKKGRRA